MYEFVVAGGWLMLPILLCSIAAAAICVERFWSLSPSKIAPANLIAQVWIWLKNDDFDASHVVSGANSWNDGLPVSAHSNAGIVYDYYRNTFNRNSFKFNNIRKKLNNSNFISFIINLKF